MIKSGLNSIPFSTPSKPSPASPQISRPTRDSRNARTKPLIGALSSTIRMRLFIGTQVGEQGLFWGGAGKRPLYGTVHPFRGEKQYTYPSKADLVRRHRAATPGRHDGRSSYRRLTRRLLSSVRAHCPERDSRSRRKTGGQGSPAAQRTPETLPGRGTEQRCREATLSRVHGGLTSSVLAGSYYIDFCLT